MDFLDIMPQTFNFYQLYAYIYIYVIGVTLQILHFHHIIKILYWSVPSAKVAFNSQPEIQLKYYKTLQLQVKFILIPI